MDGEEHHDEKPLLNAMHIHNNEKVGSVKNHIPVVLMSVSG